MKLGILTANFNDWPSLHKLLLELDSAFLVKPEIQLKIYIVDDGSREEAPADLCNSPFKCIQSVEMIYLTANVGNQRALAIGMGNIYARKEEADAYIVMDADGEDRPESVLQLLTIAEEKNLELVVAKREKRNDTYQFKFGYILYKALFQLLTGRKMQFGNFMFFRSKILSSMAYSPNTGTHLPASILKNKLNYFVVPISRGKRYFGQSSMNIVSLVIHGLSAVAVFSEVVLVRCFIVLAAIIILACIGIGIGFSIKIFTSLATPGWATIISLGFLLMLVQSVMGILFLSFLIITYRQISPWIPALHSAPYINKIVNIYQKKSEL